HPPKPGANEAARGRGGELMPPLGRRDHVVLGSHSLKSGRLVFRTNYSLLSSHARHAITTERTFAVSLTTPDGLQQMAGKVLSVDLVEGAKPTAWEIIMKMTTE